MQITGIKINSPAPQKKITSKINTTAPTKATQPKKTTTTLNRNPVKKPNPQKTDSKPKKEEPQPKKQEIKKDEQNKVEQVKEEEKKQVEEKTQVQEEQKVQPVIEPFDVTLRYNHYKDKFKCENGILSFAPVDDKYCFNLVFKGNYQPVLKVYNIREEIMPQTRGTAVEYTWKVTQEEIYAIQINEDEEQEGKYEKKVYKAPEKEKQCPLKKNKRMDELTEDMKKMGISELGSQKHKQMLEQRDLEDILYN